MNDHEENLGPARRVRPVTYEGAGPGHPGFFTVTPVRLSAGVSCEFNKLEDWWGRLVAYVPIGQSDDDTARHEAGAYMQAYNAALNDVGEGSPPPLGYVRFPVLMTRYDAEALANVCARLGRTEMPALTAGAGRIEAGFIRHAVECIAHALRRAGFKETRTY